MQQRGRIASLVLMSIAAALFGWLAVARRSGATLGFDLGVRARVHDWASPAMTVIARSLTALGSPIFLSVLFAIAMLAFYRLEWKRPAITVAEVMAGAIVCNIGLKSLIQRARPEPFFGKDPSSYSFPSGHALYSLCFYGVIASVLAAHAPERAARIGIGCGGAADRGDRAVARVSRRPLSLGRDRRLSQRRVRDRRGVRVLARLVVADRRTPRIEAHRHRGAGAVASLTGQGSVSRTRRDGRFRYARNYARDRPSQAQNQPPPAKRPKKNPSASPRLTEGYLSARLLDRPVC